MVEIRKNWMTYKLTSAMVKVGELDVHYLTGGQGEPLLVVHGGTGGSQDWRRNMEYLADKYTVYIPDMPGFGLTASMACEYQLVNVTNFLDGFTSALGLKQFRLLGHSFGGSVALSYAVTFPYKITKLVLVSSLGLGKEIAFWIRCTANKRFIRYIGRSILNILKGCKWLINQLLIPFDFQMPFSEASMALGSNITSFRSQNAIFAHRLHELSMPTLLVWGTHDPIVPYRQAYAAAQAIPDCKVKVFPGVGHSVYRERRDEFNEILMGFLN